MYQTYIGLEVHIHLLTKTKVFCGCRSAFGDEPNTNVCPVCMGYPGVLPTLNIEAVKMGCMVAKALNCRIPGKTWFERKQYFYPDMTKNYQISQFASPLGQEGEVELENPGRAGAAIKKRVRIRECHLEEDAGKMIHTGTVSLLDYNRAGVALLEIVTEPDMESGEEAELFIQQLRRVVRYLGVCDGNMEEGSLRADANVSINTPGAGLGEKVEIKNLNSSRFVRLGLNYEVSRQTALLDAGKSVVQETRLWNENRDQTEPMRTKENAHDYRYFPEPDLPVFTPDSAFLAAVDAALVELPLERQKRLTREYGLNPEQAALCCEERALADYFEEAVASALARGLERAAAAQTIANRLLVDVKHLLTKAGLDISRIGDLKLTAPRLAELAAMVAKGEVSAKNARAAMDLIIAEDKDGSAIIAERNWGLLSDERVIAEAVDRTLQTEQPTTAQWRQARKDVNTKREKALLAYLVGQTLAATGGRAPPEIVKRLVEARLAAPAA